MYRNIRCLLNMLKSCQIYIRPWILKHIILSNYYQLFQLIYAKYIINCEYDK